MLKTQKDPGRRMDGDAILLGMIANAKDETAKPDAPTKDIDAMLGNPLHGAIKTNCIELFDMLVAQGVNMDSLNKSGETTIHTAINHHRHKMLEKLLAAGVQLDTNDSKGRSPVFIAVSIDDNIALKMLLDAGFAPSRFTQTSSTAMHSAVIKENEEAVRLLLEAGAATDIPAPIHKNKTPLHLAADHGNTEIIEMLTAAGANVNARMDDGYLPIHLTKIQRFEQKFLKEAGERAFNALLDAGSSFELIETDDYLNSMEWNDAAQKLYSARVSKDIQNTIEDALSGVQATKPSRRGLSL